MMAKPRKFYFHRRETETWTRVAEYGVEAASEAEALAILQRTPEDYPSDRKGSATPCTLVDRQVGTFAPGTNAAPAAQREAA